MFRDVGTFRAGPVTICGTRLDLNRHRGRRLEPYCSALSVSLPAWHPSLEANAGRKPSHCAVRGHDYFFRA